MGSITIDTTVMVLCVVIGCSKRSGRDKENILLYNSYYNKWRSAVEKELSKKRRNGFLAAIPREGLTNKILVNDRICSRHFISGEARLCFGKNNQTILTGCLPYTLAMRSKRLLISQDGRELAQKGAAAYYQSTPMLLMMMRV